MINYIPDFLVHAFSMLGVLLILASTFLGMVPFVNTYKLPGQILGILLLSIGLYLEGGLSFKKEMDLKVAELKEQLAEAKAKANSTNVKIVADVVKYNQAIKVTGQKIKDDIKNSPSVKTNDEKCTITDEIIELHNKAASLGIPVSNTPKTVVPSTKPDLKLPPRTNK